MLEAGSMGIDTDGKVVAFGDFNGDQLSVAYFELSGLRSVAESE